MKISIITTVYNAAEMLDPTIKSVLDQEGVELEYIITDGGSTDATARIVAEHPKIKFFSEPDDGIYDGMNKGIEKATGEIVAILNAGDLLLPGILKKVADAALENPEYGVFHGGMIWTENGVKVREVPSKAIVGLPALDSMPVCHPATFVRKSIYDEYGVFDKAYRIAADHHFIHRTLRAGVQYYFLPFFCTLMDNGGVSSGHRSTIRDEVSMTIRELGGTEEELKSVRRQYRKQVQRDWLLNSPFFPGKTLRSLVRKYRKMS